MRYRKGASTSTTVISTVAVLALILLGVVAYNILGGGQTTITPTGTDESGAVVVSGNVDCPSDGTTDGRIRYEDTLQASFTQGNPTCYFLPQTAGEERITSGTLSTSDYSTAVDIKCTSTGTKWQAVCITQADNYTSAVGDSFTAQGAFAKVDLQGKNTDTLKVKVADLVTGGAKYFNITTCDEANQGAGAYTSMSNSTTSGGCTITNGAGGGETGTSLTLGADGYIDSMIYVKTNNTKAVYGEDDLNTWMLVDANTNVWDEPVVYRDNGATLVNAISSLQSEDLKKYSGYEYAYNIGQIGDRESKIGFYLETSAGVNPGSSDDPVIEFCAEGRYASSKQKDAVLVGCWTDASTQVHVFTTAREGMHFDVS